MVCGETEVAAANLRITINNLEKMTEDGTTGFQKQLKVLVPTIYFTAVQYDMCIQQILDEVCSQ